jgi:hypothetical protein
VKVPVVAVLAVAACGGAPPREGPDGVVPEAAGRVVVVSVDGLMPDAYLDPDAHGLAIPTLRALVAGGAAARVRGVMPTVTYPSHTTLVTGVPPRIHGIVANKPLDRLGKNLDGWSWYAEDIAVPRCTRAEAQHRTAALIVWPVARRRAPASSSPVLARRGPTTRSCCARCRLSLDRSARGEPRCGTADRRHQGRGSSRSRATSWRPAGPS